MVAQLESGSSFSLIKCSTQCTACLSTLETRTINYRSMQHLVLILSIFNTSDSLVELLLW